ncbi:cobalt-precorrin-5B (C(1))-methyltransferase [Arsenicitalea aurantiaca]|uniref:Cobalt-precorrin-5B C(1)-methyltransferase n=1 Tax=Arsenicitalea aurantiaca TaxID=1783274 RepID=A0A433X3Y9_9HYPH|nr:cobalt-precorrin-5B (C(1))-methyltransferase [Arsenicitalea aurantiaca]RUT28778.1 cobalt-precorrin-5B (C(1))-methyltransferase [Arsenicitalea aurantiaca]
MESAPHDEPPARPLRRGWTTGACATAATKAALGALLGDGFADPVTITLPGGQQPAFALAMQALGDGCAEAGIIKDAGDDPDVTHGALVIARVAPAYEGAGVVFRAGDGVGTVTRPGLPIGVGEPAINPVPRQMMRAEIEALARAHDVAPDFVVTISVENGARLAEKTWNPRLGIMGGLSILGTTGIVIPYSCSAWIHSIHRGIDVARAIGLDHVVGSTGDLSEKAAMARLGLAEEAYIDMGDFVGGMLKYLRTHPVRRVTVSGGFAKISKLAQGAMDLHSGRGSVDRDALADMMASLGAPSEPVEQARVADSASQILALANGLGLKLADAVARRAALEAKRMAGPEIEVDVLIVDRAGVIVGESG